MIRVKFYSLLRIHLQSDEVRLKADDISILNVLKLCEDQLKKDLIPLLSDDGGSVNQGTIILLNGRNIRYLQELNTTAGNDDIISIFPPGGGG